jgi:hypothetical protein
MAAGRAAAQETPTGGAVSVGAAPSLSSTESAVASWPPGLLQAGLDKTAVGQALSYPRIRVYGFIEAGYTHNLSDDDRQLFGRLFDARRVNKVRLNQLDLTIERVCDPSKPVDWGFRTEGFFGGDALLTHTPGLFFHAGRGTTDAWADLLQLYAQGWYKTGQESGLEATVGKFVCPMTAETIQAVGNQLYSHSYLFDFATPFTHTGVRLKYAFSNQTSVYGGIVEGWDVFRDNNDAPSYIAGASLSGAEEIGGHARNQLFLNFITGPEREDNTRDFRTVWDAVATHWWTERLGSTVNGDFGTEQHVPGVDRADWYGIAHYLAYTLNDYATSVWRSEWFVDSSGSRIGARGTFYENTVGVDLTPWPGHRMLGNLLMRPELRWDTSDEHVFDGSRNQVTVAMDVIFRF